MNIDWPEDLLAVIEEGSFQTASARRHITQPAFSRRIKSIESALGAELFDRTKKPAQLKPYVLEQKEAIRSLAFNMRDLRRELRTAGTRSSLITVASQHAISSTIVPSLLGAVAGSHEFRVRLRSANRSDCVAMLFSGAADLVILYQLAGELPGPNQEFLESSIIASDRLIPVVRTDSVLWRKAQKEGSTLSVVSYPQQEFLGAACARLLYPALNEKYVIEEIAETALTSAALQFAVADVALAWVPETLAVTELANKNLVNLERQLPCLPLQVVIQRRKGIANERANRLWEEIVPII